MLSIHSPHLEHKLEYGHKETYIIERDSIQNAPKGCSTTILSFTEAAGLSLSLNKIKTDEMYKKIGEKNPMTKQ